MYTNILFDAEDNADKIGLYDTLKRSGLIDLVFNYIDENEIKELYNYIEVIGSKLINYRSSLTNFIIDAIEKLPEKASEAMKILQELDPKVIESMSGGLGKILFTNETEK